ncbi:hypothetical protein HWD35_15115 [Tsukamurella tyrosinosolvens]|nr:hypothetical protein [Tsukamurella tyrosinosolvens]MCA4996046.1 hypothetical protein [Tsukamurella tyrosinosolvens]MEC4615177.1 hypothetical protein [Tsukamurella tyrosinosolvens]QRY85529.1 hypothetical protein JVY00_05480 [Tsukamurella tyrosinosolvens]WEL93476.1 hypothetical protein P1N98_00785 [Tsukamurella tyrosinosolvens]
MQHTEGGAMTVKHTHSLATGPDAASRSSCTVYFSRSLTRTLLTVAVLAIALVLIVVLG